MSKKETVTIVLLVITVISALSLIGKKIMKKQTETLVEANQQLEIEKENKLETNTQIETQEENVSKTNEQVKKDIETFLLTKDQEGSVLYNIITPKGEPDRKYHTDYVVIDTTGDDIPELHIRNAWEYCVFSFIYGEAKILYSKPLSSMEQITVLQDGTVEHHSFRHPEYGLSMHFNKISSDGKEYDQKVFSWSDENTNSKFDISEDCFYCGDEQVTFDEWKILCKNYLVIDDDAECAINGGIIIKNEVEWKVLQERR